MVLLGMLFFGNLLKESMVTDRLANTARTSLIDIVTIVLGFAVGASTDASRFITTVSLQIFALGAVSFAIATAGGLIFAKVMNLFLTEKINPLVGAAGVSAVPDSARVVQMVGQQEDPQNFLLMHAMAPNVAGVIGSAIAAGVLWSALGPQVEVDPAEAAEDTAPKVSVQETTYKTTPSAVNTDSILNAKSINN
jgi:oxaloacetate decarboxylase beta subunit